eukprot:TRINITY_DN1561_c0_g2_i2.p1 TRINITY_DN1561_c0_g2~~TRINITY_DN1561_c0_g2_i2.p1  ORF type:complete len:202 (+),score=39.83 TRINITY_DN1561_c0_g2_i2:177-782(+)
MTTPTLHCLPPNTNPFHPVLLRKCIPKVKHFEEIGIERFVHDTINDLIHGEYDVTPYTTFKPEDLQTLFEAFKIFTTNFVNFNLSKEQLLADLTTLGCGEEDRRFVASAIFSRKEEIRQKFANNSIKFNKNYLMDFDWKIHVTFASDSVTQCREPLLLVTLKLANFDGDQKNLVVELTRDELDKLIETLEHVNEEVVKLKF